VREMRVWKLSREREMSAPCSKKSRTKLDDTHGITIDPQKARKRSSWLIVPQRCLVLAECSLAV